ncbi:MAG: hypothetical protein CMI60_24025 [Parvibaculum sp.]|nr:hypothetical protein [Parvibaculum sp.]
MDLQEKINDYNKKFNKFPQSLFLSNNQILGLWVMGNNYTTKTNLYGAYPHGYLDRITTLFPLIKNKTLHLFSGSIEESDDYDKVDYNTGIDAHTMSDILPLDFYEMIYADPPYSVEDCDHYGCCMVKRNVVFNECYKIMKKGGILIWLDQVLPQYKKIQFKIIARIGMVKSTNHRYRVITIFEKI